MTLAPAGVANQIETPVHVAPSRDQMLWDLNRCYESPANLMAYVMCLDPETQEGFTFGDPGWEWQFRLMQWWMRHPRSLVLKARQLGVTWMAGLACLWHLEFRPGSRCLWVGINELEAGKALNRVWDMRQSLPEYLRRGTVLRPAKGARPTNQIVVQHDNNVLSSIIALPSTPRAGRGETAALVVLDEFAFQEYAQDTWTNVAPTAAKGGRIVVVSTANGVSSSNDRGDMVGGSFYHHLWQNAERYTLRTGFFPWASHPDRDERWYEENALALPPRVRAQEYPSNPTEAFILTGSPYFDMDAVKEYADGRTQPLYRCEFVEERAAHAVLRRKAEGRIRVFREPEAGHRYAIGADVASGRGTDYSAATVIDLDDMAFVAKFHGLVSHDEFAEQLHYLGRWYGTALVAIETQGGHGDTPIVFLRDGRHGRPPYPRLYRHRQFTRADLRELAPFGFPMNAKTRPLAIGALEEAVRERMLPWLDEESLGEYMTFVRKDRGGRFGYEAQDGCNDDRVLADAIALEMYRQGGSMSFGVDRDAQRWAGRKHGSLGPPGSGANGELMGAARYGLRERSVV